MAFVQTSGTKFTLDGQVWVPMGGTTYDISWPRTNANADSYINAAVAMDLNIIRIVNFFGDDLGLNEAQWAHADYILNKANSVGLKVLLDLSDYCAVTTNMTSISCPFPVNRQNWYDFVDWLFARTNTVNGRLYKNDDTIAIIAIVGEVGDHGGTVLRDFYSDVSARIKATGAQQIVHAGGQIPEISLSSDWTTTWGIQQDMLSIPTIDCISTHPYYTHQNMRDLFPLLQGYSQEKNKPWFIEEFGYNQTDQAARRDSTREVYMRLAYNLGFKYGSAGAIFWNIDSGYYNFDTNSGGGFGVNPNTPLVFNTVKRFAKYKTYLPRRPVD